MTCFDAAFIPPVHPLIGTVLTAVFTQRTRPVGEAVSVQTNGVCQENRFSVLASMLGSAATEGKIAMGRSHLLSPCRRKGARGAHTSRSTFLKDGEEVGGSLDCPRPSCSFFTCVKKTTVPRDGVSREQKSRASNVDQAGETNDDALTERKHGVGNDGKRRGAERIVTSYCHKHRSAAPQNSGKHSSSLRKSCFRDCLNSVTTEISCKTTSGALLVYHSVLHFEVNR